MKKSSMGPVSGGHWLNGKSGQCYKQSTLWAKEPLLMDFWPGTVLGQHCPIPAGLSKSHTLESNGRQLWQRGK